MTPTSYQRTNWVRVAWGFAVACAILLALWLAGRATVRAIREDERSAVLAEGDTLLKLALAQGDSLRRVGDSLRIEAAHRDTVLIHTIERVKAETAKPLPPASDTAALVAAVRSCRATLDTLASDCEAFRATANAALEAARAKSAADSARDAARAQQLAAITRSRDDAQAQLAGRSRGRAFERGVCVASLATNYLQWRSR